MREPAGYVTVKLDDLFLGEFGLSKDGGGIFLKRFGF